MAGQNYLPRHPERTYDQAWNNPTSDRYPQFGLNPMPPRSDSGLNVPPPSVPYPNLPMISNGHQTAITPINHTAIVPRLNHDHPSSSSFQPEYPNYNPPVRQTSNGGSTSYLSSNYAAAGPSHAPLHVPCDVTENRRAVLKRKNPDVPVGPIRTEYWPSEPGASGAARNWGSEPAEGSQRNIRSRQSYSSPSEVNPPRHYLPSPVTPQHFFAHANAPELRGPEHGNYTVHMAQARNISDPGSFNYDLSNGHHARNHVANHSPIVRSEPTYYAQSRSFTVPATPHQGTMARGGGHISTSFAQRADNHGPTPTYTATSASARWRQGFSEFEASSSHSRPITFSDASTGSARPRNIDASFRTSFPVNHNPSRWLFEHFVSAEDPLILDYRDLFDEHRDMRLDVDNMSYEELLALEERIGYVNTGLPDDRISKCLKEITYRTYNESQGDSCVICLEEYVKGDKLGRLRCTHDFHTTCIKKWLQMKNTCPVCKSDAFEDISHK